jgi:peptidoglycan/LPS O-acetylase OafA/YrhL
VNGKTTQKLPKLDFLRAVSVLFVILFHAGVPGIPGRFGVVVFFVISGFLITHLLLAENQNTGSVSLKNFYVRRSLRIFPAFYVYWLIAVADLIYRHRVVWAQVVCAFFYVNNYYQGLHHYPYSLLSHTWSLGIEEQFYLLWPGLFFIFRKSLKKLLLLLLIVIPCIWVYRAVAQFSGVEEAYIYTALEMRIDALLVGCTLSIVLFTGVAASFIAEVRRTRWLPVVLGLLILSLFLSSHFDIWYRNAIGYTVDPVLLALLIVQLIHTRQAVWMDSAPLSYLGRISYSTYLYQQMVIPALVKRLPSSISVVGCVIATWILASISYELIEKPFLKLKRRFEAVRVEDASGGPVTGEA